LGADIVSVLSNVHCSRVYRGVGSMQFEARGAARLNSFDVSSRMGKQRTWKW